MTRIEQTEEEKNKLNSTQKITLHRTWYNETGAQQHCLDTVLKYHVHAKARLQNLNLQSDVKNALHTLLLELEQRLV